MTASSPIAVTYPKPKELDNMINKAVLTITLACSASFAIAGHHEKGEKADHNAAEWQIKAYSSAAPDFLGDSAAIIGSDGSVLRQGTNGWICQSANPRPVRDGLELGA